MQSRKGSRDFTGFLIFMFNSFERIENIRFLFAIVCANFQKERVKNIYNIS